MVLNEDLALAHFCIITLLLEIIGLCKRVNLVASRGATVLHSHVHVWLLLPDQEKEPHVYWT